MKTLHIALRPGEKIYVNGAVIRVDRKVCFQFLNNVTFLLEQHVMSASEATTPLKQLYFIIQAIVLDPSPENAARSMCDDLIRQLRETCRARDLVDGLDVVDSLVGRQRYFEALKAIRLLYEAEQRVLFPTSKIAAERV